MTKQKFFLRKEIAELLEKLASERGLAVEVFLDYLIIQAQLNPDAEPKTPPTEVQSAPDNIPSQKTSKNKWGPMMGSE